jgi:hypothetical protein
LRSGLVTCSVLALSLLASCSGDDGDSGSSTGGSTSSTGGVGSGTGGAAAGGESTGGRSVTGGTAAGGTSAGAPGKGGSAPTGGRMAAGSGGATGGSTGKGGAGTGGGTSKGGTTADTPSGKADNCLGDGCPFGECGGPFADPCADAYPGALDESSMYCASGSDDGYCLAVVSDHVDDWAISCDGGTPTFDLCNAGCIVSGGDASCS